MDTPAAGSGRGQSAASIGLLIACLSCAAAAGSVALGLHPAIGIGAPIAGALVCGLLLWRGRSRADGNWSAIEQASGRLSYLSSNMHLMADNLDLALVVIDRADSYVFVNRTYARWLGRDRDALLGQVLGQGGDGPLRETVSRGLARARAGDMVHVEAEVALAAGNLDLSIWLVPERSEATGQVTSVGLLFLDRTERRGYEAHLADCRARMAELADAASAWLLEVGQDARLGFLPLEGGAPAIDTQARLSLSNGGGNALLASEVRAAEALARLQTVLQSIPAGFALLDRGGRIVLSNGRLGELLAGDAQAFGAGIALHSAIDGLVGQGSFAQAAGHEAIWLADRFGDGVHWTGVTEEQMADGRWLRVGGRMTSAGGSILTVMDVSALKSAHAELEVAREDARGAADVRAAMVSEFGHDPADTRGRLLMSLVRVLDAGLGAEQRMLARLSRGAAESLLDQIDEGLDLSKLSNRSTVPLAVPFEPVGLVEDIGRFLCGRDPYKSAEIGVVVGATVPAGLVGDVTRLRQALLDLSVRGLRHGSDGMVMRLDWSPVDYAMGYLRFEIEVVGTDVPDRAAGSLTYARELLTNLGGHVGTRVTNGRRIYWCTAQFSVAPAARASVVDGRALPQARVLLCLPPVAAQAVTQQLRLWRCATVDSVAPADLRGAIAGDGEPYHLALVDRALAGVNAGAALLDLAGNGTQLVLVQDEAAPDAEPSALDAEAPVQLARRPLLPNAIWQWLRRADVPLTAPGETVDAPPPPDQNQPLQVLLAEDSPTNQLVTKAMLDGMPVEIDIAPDGQQAVESARLRSYDLILMDVAMPVMDGLSATEAIRRTTPYNQHVPIIALTANTMFDDQERCLAAGMNDFLSKPITRQALLGTLSRWCREVGMPDGSRPISSAGLLDDATLSQLRHDTGQDAYQRLIASFAAEARSRQARLAAAAAAGDRVAVEHEAHSLKSTSGTYGARKLAQIAAAIEAAAMQDSLARVERDIAGLTQLTEATLQALEAPKAD
ncbi:MAG: response regulator [Alphaproteobacteria bacterium]